MARNLRAGNVEVVNRFVNTLSDKPDISAGIVDAVHHNVGVVAFRGIEAGAGIAINVVDADNNRFTTKDKKIVISATGSGGSGEVNIGANLGSGAGVYAGKIGATLNFKSLVAGSNINLSSDSNTVTISATSSGGTPAGATTEIQFNNSGTFNANSAFTFNPTGTILVIDNLAFDGNTISSTDTNGDINLAPNGTGQVILNNLAWPAADGQAGQLLVTDGTGNLGWTDVVVVDNTTNDITIGGIVYSEKTNEPILAGQTSFATALTYPATFRAAFVDYGIVRNTDFRAGTLTIINDGATVSISDTGTEIGAMGVSFNAIISGSDVVVRYTSTSGATGNMYYQMRRMEFN
jgi:hypothetical protein